MTRRPRDDEPGAWHHVVNRAIAKRPYFEKRSDQRYFLSRLGREVRAGRLEVHAYCLMTTHFHLLVRSPVGELSEAMRRVQNAYSRRFNRLRKRDGPLIRGRFFSKRAKTDAYRRAIVRYIDLNPVQARLVTASAEHEFGSARAYAGGSSPPWLSRGWVEQRACEASGERDYSPECYWRAFGARETEDLDALCSFIEHRLASASDLDPLHDLVGTTPREVRRWMRFKALLADGHQVGLPVCGPTGLASAIDAEVDAAGEWLVERSGRVWRGSELVRVGLLRRLCSLTWLSVADVTDSTVASVRRRDAEHRAAMREAGSYADRAHRIAEDAIGRTLAVGT